MTAIRVKVSSPEASAEFFIGATARELEFLNRFVQKVNENRSPYGTTIEVDPVLKGDLPSNSDKE